MKISKTTPVPNMILDDYLRHLKPVELKVMLLIVRQTLGWHRACDWIAVSQFIERTGSSRRAISEAIQNLVELGLVKIKWQGNRRQFFPIPGQISYSKGANSAHRGGKYRPTTKTTLTKNTPTKGKTCPLEKVKSIRKALEAEGTL